MRTVGVDLAAEPAKSALAILDWKPGRVQVVDLRMGASDAEIVAAAEGADRIGIDAPFGWPDAFAAFVAAHHEHRSPATSLASREDRRPLTKRRTDIVVQEATGVVPLSVSADRIAHVALRCAGLLTELRSAGVDVGRVDGVAVEVYPAAALRRWGLRNRGYKGGASDGFAGLLDAFDAATPWLEFGDFRATFRATDDAFDAVVAAIIARASACAATTLPSAQDWDVASREGWIHVPTGALADLV